MSVQSIPSPTAVRSPRLARFAAAGPVMRSTSGRLVTVPVREALAARDAAVERDTRSRALRPAA